MRERGGWRVAAGIAISIAIAWTTAPAAAGPEARECWDGEWSETGPPGTQVFAFRLELTTRDERVEGAFTWRQREVSWNRRTNGRVLGRELVRGSRHGDRIAVAGYRVTSEELAEDRYRIEVAQDGRITGRSASLEDDWTARLTGHRVSCSAAVPR